MITRLPFWRVLAWIGAGLCGKWAVKGGRLRGWRDKTAAGCGGRGARNCWRNSAIHEFALLAASLAKRPIPPFYAPSLFPLAESL